MKKRLIMAAVAFVACAVPSAAQQKYPWQNPDLPRAERVENLLQMLTPEEKVGLMMNKSISIDRLGIPSYNWWSEACHGVRQDNYTVYPQPIGMAAAFSPGLVRSVFTQVSDEARANWNRSDHSVRHVGMGEVYYPGNPELTFWCPNVNIFRDPRWGRGQETCGEDPYLNAVLGVETVLGMQDPKDGYVKTHACAKHYAVHSGPEPLRHSMNVEPSNRDLWETYLPAFKALVTKGHVREVMCAYQRFEGRPCCTSDRLLIDILRHKWGYDGLVVTDCDAINNFYSRGQHETHKDPLSASVDAVLNGTDLECGKVFMSLTEGLQKGLVKESDLDQHLRRTLTGRFELGMFDPADRLPWAKLGESIISSEEHNRLATQAARESMVLLENKSVPNHEGALAPLLPLSKNLKKLVVVGPNADDVELLNGNYGGTPTPQHQHSLLSGIQKALPQTHIIYNKACELDDEYQTVHHLQNFNGGRGVKVEFWNNKELKGAPVKTLYSKTPLDYSTFGAWGFAEGVDNDNLSVRVSGRYKATFTGEMKYTLTTDNGYVLRVNGRVVEQAQPAGRRGFGFGRRTEYKSFPVQKGKTYDVVIEYRRGNGQFAMLRGDICERRLADFTDLARQCADADAIIIIGGISARMEGEGGDKADIELPLVQQRLVRAMHQTGRPVVFVNCSGSAIAFGSVEGQYDALLQAWYPGQGGAQALADVLFGDYNPGGKLPVTFYRSTDDLPDFLDYSMKNRTYRYFTGTPQYAFGYGLSYTTFHVGQATLTTNGSQLAAPANSLAAVGFPDGQRPVATLTVPVTNTGRRPGTETIQLYVRALDDPGAPIKALKGFQKLSLNPGETKSAVIALTAEAFEYYNPDIDELSARPGRYQLLYGTSSRDADLQALDFTLQPSRRIVEDGGTGPFKAIMREDPSLPAHTVFAPQDLSPFSPQQPLPVLVWGNGACYNSPFEHYKFLNEIASHGFLVIATGYIPMDDTPYHGPMSTTQQQIASIDWAIAQNDDPQSPYYQKIDVHHICAAGMSCGGLQTLYNCADPRITLLMICNSGLFNRQNAHEAVGGMPMPPKEKLAEVHTPVMYLLGGKPDIAYENGMDDFHRLTHVPACAANLPVGHGGTYAQPHGGEFSVVALAWLQWQLKGDKQAARMFKGKKNLLQQREGWTLEKNDLFKKLK